MIYYKTSYKMRLHLMNARCLSNGCFADKILVNIGIFLWVFWSIS